MGKLIVLTFIHHYLPGNKSGGPVRTIANLVEKLGLEFDFYIVTSDRDMLEVRPYDNVQLNCWVRVGNAWVYYASPGNSGYRCWAKIMRDTKHDVLYLNSLFDSLYTIAPLLVKKISQVPISPVVLAPRGELSPGALAIKRLKKKVFLLCAKWGGLYKDVTWHASTREEQELIKNNFSTSSNIVVARNLPGPIIQSVASTGHVKALNKLKVVALSRITKMKNLEYSLKVMSQLKAEIQFDIWGSKEDSRYWDLCVEKIGTLPQNIRVEYRGVADHSDVNCILSDYDLLILPTLGENYGHVIAESMIAGTPVLVSNLTPWRDLKGLGVGWDLPLENSEEFAKAIQSCVDKPPEEYLRWRHKIRNHAKLTFTDSSIVEANRKVFSVAFNR